MDPQTPPSSPRLRASHLITPPDTNKKRIRFDYEITTPGSPSPVTQKRVRFSDDDNDDITNGAADNNLVAVYTDDITSATEQLLPVPAEALIPEPFNINFMAFPLTIRNRIYTYLLTVSGLISIRQNRTPFCHYPRAYSNALSLTLKPGVAYALIQDEITGNKTSFSKCSSFNINILQTCKAVHAEAKEVLYGENKFDMLNLTDKTSPKADFGVQVFGMGYQSLVKRTVFRAEYLKEFAWMVNSGWTGLKEAFPGLEHETLVLELEELGLKYHRVLVRKEREEWRKWVKRISRSIMTVLGGGRGKAIVVPVWMDLEVMFPGRREVGKGREDFKCAVAQAWELLKD